MKFLTSSPCRPERQAFALWSRPYIGYPGEHFIETERHTQSYGCPIEFASCSVLPLGPFPPLRLLFSGSEQAVLFPRERVWVRLRKHASTVFLSYPFHLLLPSWHGACKYGLLYKVVIICHARSQSAMILHSKARPALGLPASQETELSIWKQLLAIACELP